jgi:hypothetical protein
MLRKFRVPRPLNIYVAKISRTAPFDLARYIQKRLQGVSGARAARDGICPVPSADGRTPSDDGANAQSFGGSKWWKWKKSHEGNAYRAVYSVRYADAVYVLHALLA